MSIATTEEIRSHFPALSRSHAGHPVAYFDGPGGTQVPRAVVRAVSDYLCHHNANTHWAYPTSKETDEQIAYTRQAMADFMNASPSEIAFGANMTTLTFHLARAFARRCVAGDEIIVTELDHHANVAPWRRLAKESAVTVQTVRMLPDTCQWDWDDLAGRLNTKTRLLAIGAASNALGTINDIARACEMARAVKATVFVDAVHYAPHELIDVREMRCDFLACSAYKFYGPHLGILFGRQDLLQSLDFPKLEPAPDLAPECAETGTQNHEGIAGAGAAVDFLASLAPGENRRSKLESGIEALHARASKHLAHLWQGLCSVAGVRLYGPPPEQPRTPTLAFTVAGHSAQAVAESLAGKGIFVSYGDFYAATVVERLGLAPDGLVRAGCACYTTRQEIDRLIEGVAEIASNRV